MGKFIIKKRSNGEFQFNLHAGNGQIVLSSQGYGTKDACKKGILSVRSNAPVRRRYQVSLSRDGKHFFNLVAGNGQNIGVSEMYTSQAGMENGIESVIENGVTEQVDDQTGE